MPVSATCSDSRPGSSRAFPRARPLAAASIAVALFVALALVATWPLAARIGSHVPRGNLSNAALQYFNLWTLEWNADRIRHGFADYWHAPIFFPETHAFAFSEPLALTGALFALLAPVVGAVAGYNLTLLSCLVLNGVAARRLLLVSGVSALPAATGGALAVILPFALKELGVLQLTALFPVMFALAELCTLFSAPSAPALLRLAVWFAATLWTCLYYALFLTVFLAIGACVLLRRSMLRRPIVLGAAAALVIVCAAAAPVVLVQRAAIARYERSGASIERGSALPRSYLALPPRTLAARISALPRRSRSLYPGALLSALALTGLLAEPRGARRRWLVFCAACAVLAVLLSFGTRFELWGAQPYALTLQRYWPGFSQLRSPYRFAAFAQIFALPLAGLGLERVLRTRLGQRSRAHAVALMGAAVVFAFVEIVPLGQKLARFPHAAMHEPWIAWLAAHPGGAVAMAPPETSGQLNAFEPITLAMLQGLRHGHPLLNGYSGFFPKRTARLTKALRSFPDATSLQALQSVGVRFVVAERAWLANQNADQALHALGSAAPQAVHQDQMRVIYQLTPAP